VRTRFSVLVRKCVLPKRPRRSSHRPAIFGGSTGWRLASEESRDRSHALRDERQRAPRSTRGLRRGLALHVLQGCTEHQDGFGPSHRLPQDLPALAERKPVRSSHLSSGAPRTARKGVVNPLCAVAPASGAPDHAPRATLGINHQLSARAESPESPRCTAHPKPVTCAKFTREVQKPLGIGVQIKQEKPCGARPLGARTGPTGHQPGLPLRRPPALVSACPFSQR
jgi:hypothetical protein